MRTLVLCLATLSIVGALASCDSGTGPQEAALQGRVVTAAGDPAPSGTTVYALQAYMWVGPFLGLGDSTLTGFDGRYAFPDLLPGGYRLTAGRYGVGGPSVWTDVAPLSDTVAVNSPDKVGELHQLDLQPVVTVGELRGVAMALARDDPRLPAENALIQLWRLEGPNFVVVDTTRADATGAYAFADVLVGNHILNGTLEIQVAGPDSPIPIHGETGPFFVAPPAPVEMDTLWITDLYVDKPAVYIYPETPGEFEVRLDLGPDVRITESLPEYGDGWTVQVAADGRIDDAHDYLFYELAMPCPAPPASGWCLDAARLDAELAALAARCGLNAAEGAEFTAYWAERLDGGFYWAALPACDAALDRWAALRVSPAPDATLRVWVFFVPLDAPVVLPAPRLPAIERRGTTVIEWGGAVLPRPPA